MLLGDFLHALDGRAVGHRLGELVVFGVLHLAEVGAGGQLLQAGDLRALLGSLVDQGDLPLDILLHAHAAEGLDQRAANGAHTLLLICCLSA